MNTVTAMKDTIVQEVCEARAAVTADFDCELGKFFTWAKTHSALRAQGQASFARPARNYRQTQTSQSRGSLVEVTA
jgi:hypothetical protein